MIDDFRRHTLEAVVAAVRAGETSAQELAAAALARIEAVDGDVGAFVAVDADAALAEAAAIDERVGAGDSVGPLAGIPIGVKDLEDAVGFRTTKGSPLFADRLPATEDSVLVERLRAAGCVIVGKTNTPELGAKADTSNPLFPPTRNPWNLARSAGGSSGGSAAAVAAGMVPLATGSDGGGSLRIPSALCGLSGFKPSLGRVPSGGPTAPDWHHLSTRGVMTRHVRDLVYALDAVVGPHPSDLRSLPMPETSWMRSLSDVHAPRRVAWSPTLGYATVDPEVLEVCAAAVSVLSSLGTEIVEVDTVYPADPFQPWLTLVATYVLRVVSDRRSSPEWERSDRLVRSMVEWADASVSAVDLVRAEDECHRLNLALVELFHDTSLLLTPTVAGQTGAVGEQGTVSGEPDPNWVRFTYPFNLTRSPAGTICAGFTRDGMPVGLQIVGPQHADVAVLRLMAALEDALALDTVAPLP
jgi:Asp-tRNA(Asn)/Glu-tRNA(Gln) amidotransferase A subunit family amidase